MSALMHKFTCNENKGTDEGKEKGPQETFWTRGGFQVTAKRESRGFNACKVIVQTF